MESKGSLQTTNAARRGLASSHRWQQLAALAVLLLAAFAAGVLFAPTLPYAAPTPSLSPLPPTAIPPTATPAPTPTPTSRQAGDLLETLYIEIAPQDFARIEADRQEGLRLGILLDTNYVPATLRIGQEVIPVELRLKGDWIDHFAFDKWSFRVRAVGERTLFGMADFSIQDLPRRSYLDEWLFMENLRREGVLGLHYTFVHVVLNGRPMGIYEVEEACAPELIESQGRRQGLILRFAEDLLWEYRAAYDDQTMAPGVERFYIIDDFQSGRIAADPVLAAQRDAAFGMLRAFLAGQRPASEVFDLETMGRFLALSDLWNAHHGLIWHNLRYYYNPITGLLEPIGSDSNPLAPDLDPEMVGLPQSAFYNDPQLQAAYVRELWRVSQPGYVEGLEAEWGPQLDALRAVAEPEFGAEALTPPWDRLRRRQVLIRQMLDPYQTAYAYVEQPTAAPSGTVPIDLGNLVDLPLEVVGFIVDGTLHPADPAWVTPESRPFTVPPEQTGGALVLRALPDEASDMPYVHLRAPRAALVPTGTAQLPTLGLVTRLWGMAQTHTQTVIPAYPPLLAEGPLPAPPAVAEALAQHPFLEPVEGEEMLRVTPGAWEVSGDLILPAGYGLYIDPGTTLRFGSANILFARGPLRFHGTADAPVLLQPTGDRWQGIVVLEAGTPSTWEYVTVERAATVERDGWSLTGGVTFYRSPIRLDHCRIADTQGEDGINVVHARFEFVDSEFGPALSDAFDADFGEGVIENCVFHDTGGDGIDVSGTLAEVRSVRLLHIGDKGISVGESSTVTAQEVTFEDVRFALVSKDLSHATLTDATIVNAGLAGLAAYIKKPAYGPASITASHITFVDTPPERRTLVQTGSWIDLEGERIWGMEVDVAALYP